jgi:hypothetical protein
MPLDVRRPGDFQQARGVGPARLATKEHCHAVRDFGDRLGERLRRLNVLRDVFGYAEIGRVPLQTPPGGLLVAQPNPRPAVPGTFGAGAFGVVCHGD